MNQVNEDMEDIGLELNEEEIKSMKKSKFKSLVKDRIKGAAHSYLVQKKEGLSKLNNLTSDFSFKEYLATNQISTTEKQLLFKLRTRMIHVKGNYSSMYKDDISCDLCNTNSVESQEHVLVCPFLVPSNERCSVQYMDIFSHNLDKQIAAVKYWSKLLKARTIKLNEMKLLSGEARST